MTDSFFATLVRFIFLLATTSRLLNLKNNETLFIDGFCLNTRTLQFGRRHHFYRSTKSYLLGLSQQQEPAITSSSGDISPKNSSSPSKYADLWFKRFHALEKFKQEKGHCRVPRDYDADPQLGRWVNNQRFNKKKALISAERERMLNELGFDWDIKITNPWIENFHALLKFKQGSGHCRVPQHYVSDSASLGRWVQDQRQYKKKGILLEEREKMLDELGFEWTIKKKRIKLVCV